MIGPRRDDLRAAQIAAMVHNVKVRKQSDAKTVEELALRWELPPPEVT